MNQNNRIDPDMMERLEVLRPVLPRDPANASRGRAGFLSEAAEISRTVSKTQERRPNGWINTLRSKFIIYREEKSPMISTLATILIAVSLVLGGGGLTVVEAQSSLPNQPLYSIKLASEDARLSLASNSESQLSLELEFTQRRASEMQSMIQAGQVPPDSVQNRYQSQVEQALQIAAGLPDNQAVLALNQIQTRLQDQQQTFLHMNPNPGSNADVTILRTRQMLQDRLQWVEEGLADPLQFRTMLHNHLQQPGLENNGTPLPMGMTAQPNNGGMGGGNPMMTGSPTPGSGYGGSGSKGPMNTAMPTSGSGYGSGPMKTAMPTSGHNYGPGPMPSQTPMPGSGSNSPAATPTQKGPGSMPGITSTPGSMGNMPTPNPTHQGPQPTPGMGGGGIRH